MTTTEMEVKNSAVVSVICDEPEGQILRSIYPLIFTPANLEKLTQKVLKFPTLYGKEIKNVNDLMSRFFDLRNVSYGELRANGIFYVIDDFIGLLYLTDFAGVGDKHYSDALAHYTFFDSRHRGRVPLIKSMLKYIFDTYEFQRLSVELPNYSSAVTRQFITDCGFYYEGKKRKAALFKNQWYDINMYGILQSEVTKKNGSTKD